MKNATRVFASTFGAIMALAGLEHGIGEILQGSVAPDGIMIVSWPGSAFFRNLGGEPAMTLVPNLQLSGILTVIVSLAFLVWSVLFVHRRPGGWGMILLSIALLLVGGGIFPPVFGILVGVIATRINVPASPAKVRRANGLQHFLAALWPFSFAACLLAWFTMMPAAYLFGGEDPQVILVVLVVALATFVSTAAAGFAKDRISLAAG